MLPIWPRIVPFLVASAHRLHSSKRRFSHAPFRDGLIGSDCCGDGVLRPVHEKPGLTVSNREKVAVT